MVALVSACATQQRPNELAPIAAQLSVERFLQAANTRDVEAMGRLFGTEEGPLGDTGGSFGCFFKKIGSWFGGTACAKRTDVELRMDAIASVVQHQNYRIVREELEAYGEGLADKPVVVALNKIDTLDDELTAALSAELREASGKPVFPLSAAGEIGVEPVLDALLERLTVQRVEDEGPAEPIEWSPV